MFIKGEKNKRPLSRGSQRAHSVLDFDWYGNARDIEHLTKLRPETSADRLRFETSLRSYPVQTSFKAATPWSFNPNEHPLEECVPISQEQLDKSGFEQNVNYSSVCRIDPTKDCRGRLPDHLTLPKYSDSFVSQQNSSLVRTLA